MINEIQVKIPSQFFIYNITTSFDKKNHPLSMNSRIEIAKFESVPTFEKTINYIKYNNLKIIASTTMNPSAITLFDNNL